MCLLVVTRHPLQCVEGYEASGLLGLLQKALSDFFVDPKNTGNLPRTKRNDKQTGSNSASGSTVLSAFSDGSQPKNLYQAAVIGERDGSLCIRIADNKESRKYHPRISGLDIYELRASGAARVWEAIYLHGVDPLPVVSPSDCMSDAQGSDAPVPQLVTGKRYSVTVAAGVVKNDGRSQRRFYTGNFCMVEKEGLRHVHQVLFDRRPEVWAWDACTPAGGDRARASNR